MTKIVDKLLDIILIVVIIFFFSGALLLCKGISNDLRGNYYISADTVCNIEYIDLKWEDNEYKAYLFGIVPLNNVDVIETERPKVKLGKNGLLLNGEQEGFVILDYDGKNSPAERAGLQVNDIIRKVNNVAVVNIDTLTNELDKDEDKNVILEVEREGTLLLFDIPLNENSRLGIIGTTQIYSIGTLSFVYGENDEYFFGIGHSIEGVTIEGKGILQAILKQNEQSMEVVDVVVEGGEKESMGLVLKETPYGVAGLRGTNWQIGDEIALAWRCEIDLSKPVEVWVANEKGDYTKLYGLVQKNIGNLLTEEGTETDINYDYAVTLTDSSNTEFVKGMSGSPVIQDGRLIGVMSALNVNQTKIGYILTAEEIYERVISGDLYEQRTES